MTNFDRTLDAGAVLRLSVTESATQNIGSNYSTDNWGLYLIEGGAASWSGYSISYNVTINGSSYSGSYSFDFRPGGIQTKTIRTGSTRVYHDADGTKSISVSGYTADTNTSSGGPGTASGTFTQTPIPRGPYIELDGVWARSLAYAEIDGAWEQVLVHAEIDSVWQLVGG
jgi:hypothetical protein